MNKIKIISFNQAREIVNYTHNNKVTPKELVEHFPEYVIDKGLSVSDAGMLFKPFTADYESFAKIFRENMFVNDEFTFRHKGDKNLVTVDNENYAVKFNSGDSFYSLSKKDKSLSSVGTNIMRAYMDLYGKCLVNVREYIAKQVSCGAIDNELLYQETAIIYEYNNGTLNSQAIVRFENGIKIGNIVEMETNAFTAVGILEEGHTYLRLFKNYTYKKSKMYDLGTKCPDPMEVIEDQLKLNQYPLMDNVLTADMILERNLFNPQTLGAVSGLSLQEIHNFLNGHAPELKNKIYSSVKKVCDDGTAGKRVNELSPQLVGMRTALSGLGYTFEKPTEELIVGSHSY